MSDFNTSLSEVKNKVPELKACLNVPINIYFYPNIRNDEFCTTLLIQETGKTYKFCIYSDARYQILSEAPSYIINPVDTWLTTFDTVKNRQQQRTQLLKEELIMKIWHPDYINSPIIDL